MWHTEQIPTCTNEAVQSVRGGGEVEGARERTSFSETNREGCLSLDTDASGRQYLRNVNTPPFGRGCRLKSFERKSGTDNIPAAAQAGN